MENKEQKTITIPLRVINLLQAEEFIREYRKKVQALEPGQTNRSAYDRTEAEFISYFGFRRYSGYDGFKRILNYYKNKKR